MDFIIEREERFKSSIGYFYAMIATVFCSFFPVFNKALKHCPVSEVNIYRYTIMNLLTYLVIRKDKVPDGYGFFP